MYLQLVGTNTRILGSLHAFPAGSAGMPAWCIEAYHWAERRVLEHDLAALVPFMALPAGQSLEQLLPADCYAAVLKHWPDTSPHPMQRTKPSWAFLQSSMSALNLEPGVEPRLLALGAPWAAIENAQEVATAFDSLPIEALSRAILWASENRAQAQIMLQRLYDAWVVADPEGLAKVAQDSPLVRDPQMRVHVFDRRNEMWAERIAEQVRLDASPTLIVVGALHLVGDGSLIEALGRRGLQVEPAF